jgi:hypothetical protein
MPPKTPVWTSFGLFFADISSVLKQESASRSLLR